MKFIYQYRTKENAIRDGVILAADREGAFQALKTQGIRPSRLEEAPGILNKLFGKGKRWAAIAGLVFVASALAWALYQTRESAAALSDPYNDNGCARPIERRQIWGDDAVIQQAASKNWKVIFQNPADRLLSLFAQPGTNLKVFPRVPETIYEDFKTTLNAPIPISEGDLDEYKQMKGIVEGMKGELRRYLAAGGTIDGYLRRLVARQKQESDFLEKARVDLERQIEQGADAIAAWQAMNKLLREQGLPALSMPVN